jgi:hypothetical protein
VLSDNGKQFTGRFTKPRPSEVLFERICRDNGITTRLTRPRTPTTTGKIERWHKTLREEFLATCDSFASLAHAQAELDAWVLYYNCERPHQSLGMATPASRFAKAASDEQEPAAAAATQPCRPAHRRRPGLAGSAGTGVQRRPGRRGRPGRADPAAMPNSGAARMAATSRAPPPS